jgi:hypothetical protein
MAGNVIIKRGQKMNKTILALFSILLVAACTNTTFAPFDGDQVQTGTGGFVEGTSDGVNFYTSGLPNGKKCQTLGLVTTDASSDGWSGRQSVLDEVAKKVIAHGGNTAVLKETKQLYTGSHGGATTPSIGTKHVGFSFSSTQSTAEYTETNTYTVYKCQ